jgi:endonuclease/exonuclease/phosphatase family metal-dependent hydrolase
MKKFKKIACRMVTVALTAIVSCGAVMGQTSVSIKVMTMNIKEGGEYANYNTEAFAECIATYNPDVVVMQEVDRFTNRAGNKDILTELGAALGMFPFYGKAMDYRGGGFGNGILSKYPFYNAQSIVSKPAGASENRNCSWIDIVLPQGGKLRVAVTHLDVKSEQVRTQTMAEINRSILTDEFPVLLMGDFNAKPDSDTMKYARSKWQDIGAGTGNTIPATAPTSRIDYIMGYPKSWSSTSYEIVSWPELSDHCFVVAQIECN